MSDNNLLVEENNLIKSTNKKLVLSEPEGLSKYRSEKNQLNFFISTNNTNYVISENEIMENRVLHLKSKVTPILISLLKSEDFEFGQKSESIRLIENELKINRIATTNWLNEIYITYYSTDEKILIGILKIIEYFDEKAFHPFSHTIAIASLLNKNNEIKELGVRIFENYSSIQSYQILKSLSVESQWLKKYIEEVIKDLEKELCLS